VTGHPTARRALSAVALILAVGVAQAPPAGAEDVSARTLLTQLKVRAARESGFDQDKFGAFIDADRDGCDTRREVLISEAKTKPRLGVRNSSTTMTNTTGLTTRRYPVRVGTPTRVARQVPCAGGTVASGRGTDTRRSSDAGRLEPDGAR
jgi:hypothetical protein